MNKWEREKDEILERLEKQRLEVVAETKRLEKAIKGEEIRAGNFNCPNPDCQIDLSYEIKNIASELHAHCEWAKTIRIECPECDTQIVFQAQWDIIRAWDWHKVW